MKILVVASYNKGRFSPFVIEQAKALENQGCEIDYFGVQGKGLGGYLRNYSSLKEKILQFQPDIVHAHYGLSGLLANLQRKVPVVTTYHGSDINDKKVLPFSRLSMIFSKWNFFVSQKILEIAKPKRNYSLLPCGIDLSNMQRLGRTDARDELGWSVDKQYVLFAGAFDNVVKNAPLAKKAVALLGDTDVELVELKGYSREEVTLLMCAVDVFLMTSITEGSPQVIKEAMACGCPIVSVDVGDVKERIAGIEGCFVSEARDPVALAALINKALAFKGKTKGRESLIADGLDNSLVAPKLLNIYKSVCRK